MSGVDHRTCKGIVPSALTYWDIPPWKYHHDGSRVGPRDTSAELCELALSQALPSLGLLPCGVDTNTKPYRAPLLTGLMCD